MAEQNDLIGDHPEVIDRVVALAHERRPDDELLARFITEYYSELLEFDVDDRRADDLYAAAVTHFELGRRRPVGETRLRVFTPDRERDGWHSDRSVVMLVTDDAPFLVDTVRMALDRQGVDTHLMVHPMLQIERQDDVVSNIVHRTSDASVPVEAWTQIEIDGCDERRAEEVRNALARAVARVHAAVGCFEPMQERMHSFDHLDPLLEWLADRNFVFLGSGEFRPCRDDPCGAELVEGSILGDPECVDPTDPPIDWDGPPVSLARSHRESTVHRDVRLTVVTVLTDELTGVDVGVDAGADPEDVGVVDPSEAAEAADPAAATAPSTTSTVSATGGAAAVGAAAVGGSGGSGDSVGAPRAGVRAIRFVGLLTSSAYRQSVLSIPSVGDRARAVLGLARAGAETHAGRSMRNVLETLPRDLVFELDSHQLAELVIDVVGLQERQIVRVFDVPEPSGASSTILVYLPKRRFHARLPEQVAELVGRAYGATVRDVDSFLGASNLARVTFTVQLPTVSPDLDELSDQVDEATTAWLERVHEAAVEHLGEVAAGELMNRVGEAAPDSYRTAVLPDLAVGDFRRVVELIDGGRATSTALVHDIDADADIWRMRVYRRDPVALSDLMPMLGHLGMSALDEHPYRFDVRGEVVYLYDIGVRLPSDVMIDDRRHREVHAAFEGLLDGSVDSDGFNRLVLLAGMRTEQVNVLRTYARYTRQIGFTFSQGYIEDCLARLPDLATELLALFEARFDPDIDDGERLARLSHAESEVLAMLDAVPSLDDDRIGRMFLALIRATTRTSAYLGRPTLALKFDPSMVPDLPEPRPEYEIFVNSARVEGVHLRGGPIARGGLRWSDRPEDYRTEVLGLVKAQMVKNAVIVPVGAKGGFIVKQPRPTPAEQREEGVACYRMFVSGLLDLTDNIVGGEVVPPARVRRYDADDPYLVVAADKGTATFSDIANGVADEYGFWLGDAFASGGSVGYDHKEMGITARGAWESVRRHARVLGRNADDDELTVVGIGDMSGDVFGNGMLRSPNLKLVAAFDHRHIFLDPDPDPAVAYAERSRLFETPRSSWADYTEDAISAGGGVFPRALKSIELSPEMREVLDVDDDRLTPNELISAVLRAPVDLLWNGGIGTFVKASTETHMAVGDRTNDAVRIDASELRCRMVGEGGNLGVTQLGRVEYALHGGLIYTDAIDNSAGVDCSDHEVNIKILLGDAMVSGELTEKQRNELLEEMTDEVADLVLANNKAQTLALLIARTQGLPMVNVHARYLDQLEHEGWIDRELEFLPTDKQIAERQATGSGLRTPELAVMIAYSKNAHIAEIMATDLPDDPALEEDLVDYFPTPLRKRYDTEIRRHRLRRGIAATQLVNQLVNLAGISYVHRMTEDTGSSVSDVGRAWVTVREILDFPTWWVEVGELDHMELDHQLDLYLDCRRGAERCSSWFMRHRRPPVAIATEVARFREPVLSLAVGMPERMCGRLGEAAAELVELRVLQGVPEPLAVRSSVWRLLHTTFDMVELAHRTQTDPLDVASAYWEMFDRFELLWLWDGIGALPRSDRWQTQARSALRDDLLGVLAGLTHNMLEEGSVDAWMAINERSAERAMAQLTQIRRTGSFHITNLSVALRQLRNLVQTSVRGS